MRFTTATRSPDVTIHKVDAFEFLNTSSNDICKFSYIGPSYVMFNQTSDCLLHLQEEKVNENGVTGVACSNRQRPSPNASLWTTSECLPKNSGVERKLKDIKRFYHAHYINCQGYKINANHEELPCPIYIFVMPETESFNIDDFYYSHKSTNLISKVSLESTTPARINLQLRTYGMKFKTQVEASIKMLKLVNSPV